MAFHESTTASRTPAEAHVEQRGRILFVCTGNICRSAFGQHYLYGILNREVPDVYEVHSAGTQVNPGLQVPDQVRGLAPAAGLDALGDHAPIQLQTATVDHADLVLVATQQHSSRALQQSPTALNRTFTVLEFAALAELMLHQHVLTNGDLRSLARSAARLRSRVRSGSVAGLDLADPYGGSDEGYRTMGEQMAPALDQIAELLVAHARSPRPRS